jgi:CheY-like chemotaxis protein
MSAVLIPVLIIEDRPEFGAMLARFFIEWGCEPTVVATVDAALAYAGEKPKIITVDLNLGEGQNAEKTIPRISEIAHSHPDSLVVVISGVVKPKETQRLFAAGAHGFIPKLEVGTLHGFGGSITAWLRGLSETPEKLKNNVGTVEALAKHFSNWTNDFTQRK